MVVRADEMFSANGNGHHDLARDAMLERPNPSSPDAESAILGAIILDNSLMSQAMLLLKPEDFYVPSHRRIYMAMIALWERDDEINQISIAEELRRDGLVESVGGVTFITNLMVGLPHFVNLAKFAKTVVDYSRLRQLVKACNKITCEALEAEDDPDVILERAEEGILSVTEQRLVTETGASRGWQPMKQIAGRMSELYGRYYRGDETVSVKTYIPELDQMLGAGGFELDDLVVIAGRTSFGKTTFALNMARLMAIECLKRGQGEYVGFISREMSSQRLFKRIHAAHIQMNAGIIRPNIYEHDYRILMDSLDEVGQLPILIDEFTSSISGARAQFKEGKQRRKMIACFVDYLQLMKSANKQGNRQQEVSDIARGLKDAARDYNMPIIALSQLSRKNMQEDRAPELSDLRESGEIEQAARTVIFLHGEKIKVEAGQPYPRIRHMECIIAKQGDGPLGSFPLRLDSPYLTFHTPMLDEAWARVRHTTVEEIDAERGPDGLESEDDSEWSVN